nr:glutamine--fructose-6-phosphate transaminase (isomerizing) [Lachnospiraceae bacterium]
MCGIVGFVGKKKAAPILLDGLSKLEYRGYDSAGIAVRNGDKPPVIVKAKGRLKDLSNKIDGGESVEGFCGIGHTRWATHGEPSEVNAHPHAADDMNVIAVHNGIIENYQELKEKLIRHKYKFESETDTEVCVKLIDYYYKKYQVGPIDAIAKAMVRIRGSYALAVLFKDYPGEIYFARKDSPLVLGRGDGENYAASDAPAILKYTRSVYYIGNLEMAKMDADSITFYNLDGDTIEKEPTEIQWDAEAAEKGGYEHFMMKEIHEQPRAIRDTINSIVENEGDAPKINFEKVGVTDEELKDISTIYIVACGSAYHVGMTGQYILEDLAGIPVRVEVASEFRYRKNLLDPKGLAVIISQSGETADSLAGLRKAKDQGVKTLAIVNVVGSSIAREADYAFYTLAGPEIAVATTKAYSTQLIAIYLLAIKAGMARGLITEEKGAELLTEMRTLPDKI